MERSKPRAKRLYDHLIEGAVDVLNENIEHIPDVKSWAEQVGYSRSHFSKKVKEYFGESPSQILVDVRIKQIRKKILAHPYKSSYAIARMVGLKTDDNLYKFLSRHYDTNFTELRDKLLSSGES